MTRTCKRCIHENVCSAKIDFLTIIDDWNSTYPHIQLNKKKNIAEWCDEFKTLSDTHIQLSNTFQQMTERFHQIYQIQIKRKSGTCSSKEQLELKKAFSDVNSLFLIMDASEQDQIKKYASKITGVKIIES